MKKLILVLAFASFSTLGIAQITPPGIAWRTIDWFPTTPNHVAIEHEPAYNEYGPGEYQDQEESGEDWWMDVQSAYQGTTHVGYMVTGFTRFPGYSFNTLGIGGCNSSHNGDFDTPLNPLYDDCEQRSLKTTGTSPYVGVAGFYDLNGKCKWMKEYSLGGDAYYALIQDSDGNFVNN